MGTPRSLRASLLLALTLGVGGCADKQEGPGTGSDSTPATTEPVEPITAVITSVPGQTVVTEQVLTVTLSRSSTVLAACEGASERHTLASTPAEEHQLFARGLLADTDYSCTITLDDGSSHPHDFTTGSLPDFLPTATPSGTDPAGYLLVSWFPASAAYEKQHVLILDTQGRVRWYWDPDVDVGAGVDADYVDGKILVGGARLLSPRWIDLSEGIVWTAPPPFNGGKNHHEVELLPNGSILTMATETLTRPDATTFEAFVLDEQLPDGSGSSWTYSSGEAYDRGVLPNLNGADPWHANAAQFLTDEDGPCYYVSLAGLSRIVRIDYLTGELGWRLGKDMDFQLQDMNGTPVASTNWFFGQHRPITIGNRILVYDNGNARPGLEDRYSRAIEVEIDIPARTARVVWEWTEPGFYTSFLGGLDLVTDDILLLSSPNTGPAPVRNSEMVFVDRTTSTSPYRLTFDSPDDSFYRSKWIDGCDIFRNATVCPGIDTP